MLLPVNIANNMAAPIGRAVLANSVKFLTARRIFWNIGRRLLLTNEYKCDEEWSSRLQTPLLQQLNMENFLLKIQEKMDKEGAASAVDMDILANKLETIDAHQLDFVQNLFYRFRHSKEAINVRESMSHAIVRSLLNVGETERLMNVLRDKVHYGIFLDSFTANLLLDYFIENKQFKEAAEVAVDLMLQEDFSHPLSRMLSWFACRLRVEQLLTDGSQETNEAAPADDGELMYRRVDYIENPWYDDHFDIPTERQRIGKTLTFVATPSDDTLSRGDALLGWALYEKLDVVLQLLQDWTSDTSLTVALNTAQVDRVRAALETITTGEIVEQKEIGLRSLADLYPVVTEQQKAHCLAQFTELVDKLKSAGKLATVSDTEADRTELLQRVSDTLARVGASDSSELTATYRQWITDRQQLLDEQIKQREIAQRKREIARRLLELRAREEKLRFFDEQTKIELKITELPSDWDRPVSDDVSEEQYVAPPGERKGDAGKRAK